MSILVAVALTIAVWVALDYVYFGRGRKPRSERLCVACGHERGWHRTYWPTHLDFTRGCAHPSPIHECHCPAGRRSIR